MPAYFLGFSQCQIMASMRDEPLAKSSDSTAASVGSYAGELTGQLQARVDTT